MTLSDSKEVCNVEAEMKSIQLWLHNVIDTALEKKEVTKVDKK